MVVIYQITLRPNLLGTMHHHDLAHHQPSHRLNVIAVVSNPVGYESRYKLFKKFATYMSTQDVNLIIVELAFGHRAFQVTSPNTENHVQVRGHSELWHKENLINLGFARLPHDWQYAAWIDADLTFLNPDWVHDCLNALQNHKVVQLFQNAIDLGPHGQSLQTHTSFGYLYASGAPMTPGKGYYFPHPGFAWAIRRDAFDHLGRLVDWAILGAADHHMAWALVGNVAKSLPKGLHPNYVSKLLAWENRAEHFIRRDLGFVPGTITHHFHGKKKDRRYVERWRVLLDNHYDPERDIKYNHWGVLELDGRNNALRDGIRAYMRARNEDSVDLE